ncbi:hypothetical protein GT037_002584 [Alternaria burnsii]|uniref:Uncharacterized protein n=1 Tax=Alternaria burnsii TaxID=1187904 RepID=A0A8H7EI41_9PLEO|nr:uncharacterized protein GT037_002584 [Alternaria burnsii]KAF7678836.1 hypothetical protein GT037_002584 [Alternaria burnsii]
MGESSIFAVELKIVTTGVIHRKLLRLKDEGPNVSDDRLTGMDSDEDSDEKASVDENFILADLDTDTCYDKLACEELPMQIEPDWLTAHHQDNSFKFSTYDYHHQPLVGDRAQPMIRGNEYMHTWLTILEQYTKCRLTFPKDKLVAISGIARLFCEPLADTYCAGLWIRRMPIELLWKRGIRDIPKPAVPKSTQECYRAPSWSWASVDGPVTPEASYDASQDTVVILVEIKSCHADTKTGDAFSEVLNGIIRLSGFLSKMRLRPVADSESVAHWSAFVYELWLDHADRLGQPRIVLDHKPLEPQEMFCLPIVLFHGPDDWELECLILVAIEGKKDTFKRFGRLTIPVDELLVADYRNHELGGEESDIELGDEDSDYELQAEDSHVKVQSRDSAWHYFILSLSKHIETDMEPDDSLDWKTIAVPGAVEISIE